MNVATPSTPNPTSHYQWFVVHTKPRQGFESWLPVMDVEKIRRKQVAVVTEPLFSRYLFVRLDKQHSNWAPIRSTLGVNRLVTFGNQPAAVPDELVLALQEAEKPAVKKLLLPGDAVVFVQGPLRGLQGIYQQPDGDLRAMVLIELMSQPQRVVTDVHSLRPASR